MKVALVHDWLTGLRGGERCLIAFLKIYPDADIYTLIHMPGAVSAEVDSRVKHTSFFQRLPGISRYYRFLLPLFPLAIRKFNFEGYDLVISLSHAAAKNIRVPSGTQHVCYCFTPMRYIWDESQNYFGVLTPLLFPILSYLRAWDRKGSLGVHRFVAISRFVSARIRKFYKRKATVIYPPVEAGWITPREEGHAGQAFLYAGALVPYKRPEIAIKAFNKLGLPLWVAGTGPEEGKLRAMANSNITFLGRLSDEQLAERYRDCRALIFPGCEDFGIIPLECLAAGRPVIGLFDGALRETLAGICHWSGNSSSLVIRQASGVFIDRRADRLEATIASINFFLKHEDQFSAATCTLNAGRFSQDRFFNSWRQFMDAVYDSKAATLDETVLPGMYA